MLPWLVLLALLLLVVGGGAFWCLARRAPHGPTVPPAVAAQGYGQARWEREQALWRGVIRRLEIQARHQSPIPPRLQQELDEARARLAEAERHLQA